MPRKHVDAQSLRPHLVRLEQSKGNAYPAGLMLVSSPGAIGAIVGCIPEGRVLRLGDLRATLAAEHGADYTCPMTTGIYLRMLAESVESAGAAGETPWWRVVRDDGRLLETLPGGVPEQRQRLEREGHVMQPTKVVRLRDVSAKAWTPIPR